jgi:hypothetical protein
MGRLGQDKPAFGWELEPLPGSNSHPKAGLSWPSLPIGLAPTPTEAAAVVQGYLTYKKTHHPRTLP